MIILGISILAFLAGLIVGWFGACAALLTYRNVARKYLDRLDSDVPEGTTQFVESVSDQEKFNQAKNIGDLL